MEMMAFKEYQKLSARTQNPALTDRERFCHAALGLNAEIEELRAAKLTGDVPAIEDETGDILWMIAEMCDCFSLRMSTLFTGKALENADFDRSVLCDPENHPPRPVKLHFDLTVMTRCAARISGYAQKTLQGHEVLIDDLMQDLQLLFICLRSISAYHKFSLRHIMWKNVEKLKRRYPDGFSAHHSTHRQSQQE